MSRKEKRRAYMKAYGAKRKHNPSRRLTQLLSKAKCRAAKHAIPFSLTFEDTKRLFVEAIAKWRAIGIEFDFSTPVGRSKNSYVPSFDQIIPGNGYTLKNTQIVPWAWNSLRGDHFTNEEAESFCRTIADKYRWWDVIVGDRAARLIMF